MKDDDATFRRRQLTERIRRAVKLNAWRRELRSYPAGAVPISFDLATQTYFDPDRNPVLFYGDAGIDARPYDPDAVIEEAEIASRYRTDTEGD